MSYLEELLPEFRKGAKIRQSTWGVEDYILLNKAGLVVDKGGDVIYLGNDDVLSDNWELYQDPIDWDYIVKNKCLCWFWDEGKERKIISSLKSFFGGGFYDEYRILWDNCRPIRRDEVTFYEDRKDE